MRLLLLLLCLPGAAAALPPCEPGLLVLVADLRTQGITLGPEAGLCRIRMENGAEVIRHPALLSPAEAGDTPPDQAAADQSAGG